MKGSLKGWLFVVLLVIVLGITGGCVGDKYAEDTSFVLAEISTSPGNTGSITLEGRTVVHSANLPDLTNEVRSMNTEPEKNALVLEYLILQERIDCIIDGVVEAAENDVTVRCQGKVLVDEVGENGLLGVSEMLETVNSMDSGVAKREYLTRYMNTWHDVKRVNRVNESLAQMERTNAIPIFGSLVRAIHNFPILYEGDELVPKEEITGLLSQFSARDTDKAKRIFVKEYLER